MLDINLIRKDPEGVKKALLKRMDDIDFTELLALDKERRDLISKVEILKSKRNKVSSEIPKLKREGKDVESVLEEMKSISDTIKEYDVKIKNLNDPPLKNHITVH